MFEKINFEQYVLNSERETTRRTITETDIVLHAGQTSHFFPHHTDAEWCKSQPFKQRMAYGTPVCSAAVDMTENPVNEVAMGYGYDRMRFIKLVFTNDTIRV
ncbi:MAG TPA: MaoC/PaaZ C-terminal domain-containing protein [Flavisolibacter sp.]|jgi:acyl dehydratase|nr:MaoC/PaaZ C-terminal domain-containing protein [Flavisolibacter sp.]